MISEEIFKLVRNNPYSATKQVLMIMQALDEMPKSMVREKTNNQLGYGRPHVIRLFNQSIEELDTPEAIKFMEDLKDKYLREYLGHTPMYFSERELDIL